jgi:hypothetical protein
LIYLILHSTDFVLDSYETRPLTTREENRETAFDGKVLENIFGPRRQEATERYNRMHNDELYDSNYSPNITRMI